MSGHHAPFTRASRAPSRYFFSLPSFPDPPDAHARGGTSDDDIIQAKAELRLRLSARDVMPSDAAAFPRIVAPERHHGAGAHPNTRRDAKKRKVFNPMCPP